MCGGWDFPALHTSAAAHCVPHPPQLFLSVFVFTQVPLHIVWPAAGQPEPGDDTHWPAVQLLPEAHLVPQDPQWALSVFGSTHAPAAPLHFSSPAAQVSGSSYGQRLDVPLTQPPLLFLGLKPTLHRLQARSLVP